MTELRTLAKFIQLKPICTLAMYEQHIHVSIHHHQRLYSYLYSYIGLI